MQAHGLLTQGGGVFATQIAHEGNPAHEELEAFAKKHGYEVAYDGLVLNL
jgi:phosphoribosyl 1,2-cyclic phosphate phosphodiesterase